MYHVPVLTKEILEGLGVQPGGVYVDATLGGGGHFEAVIGALGENGIAVGIDKDPDSISWVRSHVTSSSVKIIIEQSSFSQFDAVLNRHGLGAIDGLLLDLGVSSRQIDSAGRGFSYQQNSPLDMRMNPDDGIPAHELLSTLPQDELARIFRTYGEVENAGRLAKTIKEYLLTGAIRTSGDLKQCLEAEYGTVGIKLLSKSFQALRIAVNSELDELETCLEKAVDRLGTGGRIAVISYHSLEDRIVKNFFRTQEHGCTCPVNLPVCICGKSSKLKRITRKSISPSAAEIERNRRSRSAHLRIAEKI
jgi:16S rRNA (cytosine1402-N4)-methyltransferase